jgi:hypothetical protein
MQRKKTDKVVRDHLMRSKAGEGSQGSQDIIYLRVHYLLHPTALGVRCLVMWKLRLRTHYRGGFPAEWNTHSFCTIYATLIWELHT